MPGMYLASPIKCLRLLEIIYDLFIKNNFKVSLIFCKFDFKEIVFIL
jgi:hypothetical protein